MGKLLTNILFIIFISFTTIFSKEKDGREIIKAYEKGKPAKMDIEITKVKTHGIIDLSVDEENKKLHTKFKNPEKILSQNYKNNSKQKLFITENIDTGTKENLKNEFDYKITEKGQLEINYNEIPQNIYFWVMTDNSKKLYKGNIKSLDSLIDKSNTYMYAFEREKVSRFINRQYTFKIGRVQLKEGSTLSFPNSSESYRLSYIEGGAEGKPIPDHNNIVYNTSNVDLYYKELGKTASSALRIDNTTEIIGAKTYEILGVLPERFTNKRAYELLHSIENFRDFKMKINDSVLNFKNYQITPETFDNEDEDVNEPTGLTFKLFIPKNYSGKIKLSLKDGNKVGDKDWKEINGIYSLGSLDRNYIKILNEEINKLPDTIKITGGYTKPFSYGLIFSKDSTMEINLGSGSHSTIEIPLVQTRGEGIANLNNGKLILNFYDNYFSVDSLNIDFGVIHCNSMKGKTARSKSFSIYDQGDISFTQIRSESKDFSLKNGESEIKINLDIDTTIEDIRRAQVVATIVEENSSDITLGEYTGNFTMSITLGKEKRGGKF